MFLFYACNLSLNNLQGILALKVDNLGMSLSRMGKPSEKVKFLDDVDLTLSVDSRSTPSQQWTSIEIFCKPVIFRASYRDIILITSIFNKSMESYSESQKARPVEENVTDITQRPRHAGISATAGKTSVTMIKEQVCVSQMQIVMLY